MQPCACRVCRADGRDSTLLEYRADRAESGSASSPSQCPRALIGLPLEYPLAVPLSIVEYALASQLPATVHSAHRHRRCFRTSPFGTQSLTPLACAAAWQAGRGIGCGQQCVEKHEHVSFVSWLQTSIENHDWELHCERAVRSGDVRAAPFQPLERVGDNAQQPAVHAHCAHQCLWVRCCACHEANHRPIRELR